VVALVNVGHEITNVNLLQEGVPLLTRDLSIGTRKIREDLQRERGVSGDEADRLLQGFDPVPELESYILSRGEEIAVGIERAAAFLQSASRDAGNVQHVYCSGGGSRIPGLAQVLANRLNLPVDMANPLQRLRVRDGVFDTLNADEVAPLLMLSVGLALRHAN
jgi:type IV pilus assembly protein PilM